MKIAIYCRTSTNRQENDQTIESQIWALKKYAKEQGWEIVKEYRDDGWSGELLARPDLDKLRDDAKLGLFEAVLVVDFDRIARKFAYQALILDELEEDGLQVLSPNQSQVHTTEDKILLNVRGIFAEYERLKIGERTRRGKLRKASEGTLFGWNAPYGYRYVADPEPHFEIVEEEAEVVKMIFNWIDEGSTIRGVIRKLKELDIFPKKAKRDIWVSSTVSRLVRNEVYVGIEYYNKNYAVVPVNPKLNGKYKKIKKSSRRLRPKDEWFAIKVPPLLEQPLFDRVQERLKENKIFASGYRKREYLLTGQVLCACGRNRIGEGTAEHVYYRCTDRIYNFPLPRQCFVAGVNSAILDDTVWKETVRRLGNPDFVKLQAEKYLASKSKSAQAAPDKVERINEQMTKQKAEDARYLKAYGAGAVTLEQLKEHNEISKRRLEDLQKQRETAKEMQPIVELDLSHFGAFLEEEVVKSWDFEKKQTLLRNLLLKVTVESQTSAVVKGAIPLESQVQNVGYSPESRDSGVTK